MARKVLTPEQIALIGLQRQTKARKELYDVVLKTIRKYKKETTKQHFLSCHDINNVLATLIKQGTE